MSETSRSESRRRAARETPPRRRGAGGAARTDGRPRVASPGSDARVEPEETMWALTYDAREDPWEKTRGLRKTRVPRPTLDETRDPLDASRVILRVVYTGFCGSDAGIWFRTSFKSMIHDSLRAEGKTTRVVGHEVLGVIEEAGSVASARYGFRRGQLCAAESHIVCGKCHQCLMGQTHVCVNEKILGISRDGGFAEYIKLPATVLWRTDRRRIRPEVAAIQEPFGNAVHASTAVDLRGKTVAVFGCGAIGQFTILIARALGAARIIGVEPNPGNARLARRLGADHVVEFTPVTDGRDAWRANRDVVDQVVSLAGRDGADVCIEMAGFNSSVNNAFQSVRRGGEVVLFGIKSGDFRIEDFQRIIVKGVTTRSIIGRRIFETWEIARSLLETKENGIQEKIWTVMLNRGRGTIVDARRFDPDAFEKKILRHPKVLIRWSDI